MLARPKDVKALEAKGPLPLARRFQALAAENDMSLVRLAYGFILSHPGVSTVVGGFSSIEQLDDTIAAAADYDALPNEVMEQIKQIWLAE